MTKFDWSHIPPYVIMVMALVFAVRDPAFIWGAVEAVLGYLLVWAIMTVAFAPVFLLYQWLKNRV